MTETTFQPADTRIMGVVHSALRRDLRRAHLVLSGDDLDDVRRVALARHLTWLMDFLHHHHSSEDAWLYPTLLERSPATAAILEEMDGEHRAVHPAMDRLRAAADALAAGGSARAQALAAVDEVSAVLDPHLAREELELMPLVAEVISVADWAQWDEDYNLAGKSPVALAFEGHWLMDGTDAESYQVVTEVVPPVPRFVILHFLAWPYRRRARRLWAGTPAEAVPSLTVQGADQ